MDDLGRVVIPKEIRRTLKIREGDPLEIYTEKDGGVIFRKYSPMGELQYFLEISSACAQNSAAPEWISQNKKAPIKRWVLFVVYWENVRIQNSLRLLYHIFQVVQNVRDTGI